MRQETVIRYSEAFKIQVVNEIERCELTLAEARRKYGIPGNNTIQPWLRKFGKEELLTKVVRVESRNERDRIKELEKQKQDLESALAQAHLKVIALETLIEVAQEHYKIDLKKSSGTPPPSA
jgi:transposase